MDKKKLLLILLAILSIFLTWSAIKPNSYGVWFLEVLPVLIGVPILIFTYKKFKFTNIVYIFILLHSIILIIGGHYTYAENPLFNWLKDYFSLSRNYYDRLGHIAQGFFPAIIIRELLLKKTKLERNKMLFFIIICVVLAISASYELFEWGASVTLTPGTGNAFLATQGDIWDSQWDMLLAFISGIISLLLFSKLHDKQLKGLK